MSNRAVASPDLPAVGAALAVGEVDEAADSLL